VGFFDFGFLGLMLSTASFLKFVVVVYFGVACAFVTMTSMWSGTGWRDGG
jgi:hypothetical protein